MQKFSVVHREAEGSEVVASLMANMNSCLRKRVSSKFVTDRKPDMYRNEADGMSKLTAGGFTERGDKGLKMRTPLDGYWRERGLFRRCNELLGILAGWIGKEQRKLWGALHSVS